MRYLRGAEGRVEGRRFLRFVTIAAVGGVAIGTAALLLALTIVRGFSREIEAKVVGFGQHVQAESYVGGPLTGADSLMQAMEAFPHVERVTPAIIEFALLRTRGQGGVPGIEGTLLWGTPSDGQPFVQSHIRSGAFTFTPDARSRPGLVLGEPLAQELGLDVGDAVTVFSTRHLGVGPGAAGALGARPRVRQYHVAGLFETGLADFDERFVFVDVDEARRLFDYAPDEVSRIDLTLDDIQRSPEVAQAVSDEIGPPVYARSVYEIFRNLFAWVRLQQSIVPLVISILVGVAAFNIVGTILMVILDKTREIGVLLAMGASRRRVRRLFLTFGLFVGVVGALIGTALALGLALIQLRWGVIPLPQEAYYLDTAPIELRWLDFALVPVLAVALCAAAAWFPARVAARVQPVRAIRFGA